MNDWVADIAQFLKNTNFLGGNSFAFQMPEEVQPAAMVIPPLEGLMFDPQLPGRYKGAYQVLVRTKDLQQAHVLGAEVLQLLTLYNVTLGGVRIVLSEPISTPIVFPRTEADQFEASVNMRIIMIDPRIFNPSLGVPNIIYQDPIRIWYDFDRDSIFISSSKLVYPDRSLVATQLDDLIMISIANNGATVIPPKNYQLFANQAGETFNSSAEVLQYLNVQFSASDRAATSGETISFTQSVPASTWTVLHNLGQDPSAVSVYVGGVLVFANVDPIDDNTIQINFAQPQTGKVLLRR